MPSKTVIVHQPQKLSPIGTLSLVTLIIQNAAVALITRQSRMAITTEEQRYHTSTVILNNEIVKMAICLVFFWFERRCTSLTQYSQQLYTAVFQPDTWKLSVPAFLFTIQNFLIFLSLANLDVMTFQMLSQTKLLSAAIFSVWLLHRKLNSMQWVALLILTLGVILAHVHTSSSSSSTSSSSISSSSSVSSSSVSSDIGISNNENLVSKHLPKSFVNGLKKIINPTTTSSASSEKDQQNFAVVNFSWIGVIACIVSGLSSSFAGVYFEKVVKTSAPSLAVRNIHLSLFGIPFAILSMFVLDVFKEGVSNFKFFQGYTPLVWLLVFTHAVGGLLVAAVVKYADNILKGFATALATVLSGIYAAVVWKYFPTFEFVIGCVAVFGSVILFHYSEGKNNNNSGSGVGNEQNNKDTSMMTMANDNINSNSAGTPLLMTSTTSSNISPTLSGNMNQNQNNSNSSVGGGMQQQQQQNSSSSNFFQFHHSKKDVNGPPTIKIGK
jgi:UDP-sugar transporter A1/2/3